MNCMSTSMNRRIGDSTFHLAFGFRVWCYAVSTLVASLFGAYGVVSAQRVDLFGIVPSTHPVVQAKFYAFDNDGIQQRPTIPELAIKENGIVRTITRVSCPPPVPPKALSSVLVMDVSGSMGYGGLDLAKTAAQAWINGLPPGESECALTVFSQANALSQDFTTDKERLLDVVANLRAFGGTNYNSALIDPAAGGLQISTRGKYQKVIIILTDGMPNFPPNTAEIIAEAKRQNCVIYSVTLYMPAPESLRQISGATGGTVFENVTTVRQADSVYRAILRLARGSGPCTIEWLSERGCSMDMIDVELGWQDEKSVNGYRIPGPAILALEFDPMYNLFQNPPIGKTVTKNVTVTARNAPFDVIDVVSSDTTFRVTPTRFSLQPNESRTLTLSYSAIDSAFTFARLSFKNSLCDQVLYSAGGYRNVKSKKSTLRLTHPNGGETFVVGNDTVIKWEGIPPMELVQLDLSIDSGKSWKRIDTARGLAYRWTKVPRPVSDSCLVRVRHVIPEASSKRVWNLLHTLEGHDSTVRAVDISPDGALLASGSADASVKVWNLQTGKLLWTSRAQRGEVRNLKFSPDGMVLAAAGFDTKVTLWDRKGNVIRELPFEGNVLLALDFAPHGVTIAASGLDNVIRIWDVATGALVKTYTMTGKAIWSIDHSPDASTMVVGNRDGSVKLIDLKTGQITIAPIAHEGGAFSVAYSPDGKWIGSGGEDRRVKAWEIATGITRSDMKLIDRVHSVAFSPDGLFLASTGTPDCLAIWDLSTGKRAQIVGKDSYIEAMSIAYSPDGNTIVVGSNYQKNITVWTSEPIALQEDASDSLFSIVEPIPEAIDVDMKECLVGSTKDSVVNGLVSNVGTYPFTVRNIYFSGADSSAFGIVSGIPPYNVARGVSRSGEIRFQPQREGLHQAKIIFVTQSDTLVRTVRGVGVAPTLSVVCPIVDFGRLAIGDFKDTLGVASIRNIGKLPVTITGVQHSGPNEVDFSTIAGGGSFTLQPDETRMMDLRFTATTAGRTSGSIQFSYNGLESPVVMQLFADVYECTTRERELSLDSFKVAGAAIREGAIIALTPSATYQAGSAWLPQKFRVLGGFDIRFKFRMLNGSDNGLVDGGPQGADGVALVLQNSTPVATGSVGDGVGYHELTSGLAVEFDAYQNPAFTDPSPNHIAVQVGDGRVLRPWHRAPYLRGVTSTGVPAFVANGTTYHARVKLLGRRLRVYCDTTGDLSVPLLTVDSVDLRDVMSLSDDGTAYVGFTSATGFAQQRHELVGVSMEDCDQLVSVAGPEDTNEQAPGIRIVPTPAQSAARIEFTEPLPANAYCKVYDARGIEVSSFAVPAGSVSSPLTIKGLTYGSYRVLVQIDHHVIVVPLLIAP